MFFSVMAALTFIWFTFYNAAESSMGSDPAAAAAAADGAAAAAAAAAAEDYAAAPLAAVAETTEGHGPLPPPSINQPPVPRSGVPSHWTPITVGGGSDPTVTLCKLDYDTYWRNPSKLPMFKDLVGASGCSGRNTKSARLSVLKAEMEVSE